MAAGWRCCIQYTIGTSIKKGVQVRTDLLKTFWGIALDGASDEELALAGIDALAAFIKEIGLPTTLKELGARKDQLKEIADSCGISGGSYKR